MTKTKFPTPDEILEYILAQGGYVARREIAKAFLIKGEDRRVLKDLLKQMVTAGTLEAKGKTYQAPELNTFTIVEFLAANEDGDLLGCIIEEEHERFKTSVILEFSTVEATKRLEPGQKFMAKLRFAGPHLYALCLRRVQDTARALAGILRKDRQHFLLEPLDRKDRNLYAVDTASVKNLQAGVGDFVTARFDQSKDRSKVVLLEEVVTKAEELTTHLSRLAIHRFDLPQHFSQDALQEAEKAQLPKDLEGRVDLRALPLVTIDDIDARDHDDAVYAELDQDPHNKGGWRLLVAIADVSHFVKPGNALDHEARQRGNSVYFPDQVVPMLPERLSNNLCSLRPEEDRPCLAVWMRITKKGKLLSKQFMRALMRSHAKLTYVDVQAFKDKKKHTIPQTLDAQVITDLYKAYAILKKGREARGTLDLDLTEQKIILNDDGSVKHILPRKRLDSHQLIEEFMILANVAAAEFISDKNLPCLFRVHDNPKAEKVEELRLYLENNGLSFEKAGALQPVHFTRVLKKVQDLPIAPAINELVLRTQAQANYSPDNIGHFGLNLPRYAHFTSPIRRYADLTIHRALISLLEKQKGLYPYNFEELLKIGQDISDLERRAAKAERETVDRYIALYLENRTGEMLPARISGMTDFAVFLTLEETGSDGILPLRNLTGDYFVFDPKAHAVIGRRTKQRFTLGDPILVCLETANPVSGSLIFSARVEGKQKREVRGQLKQKDKEIRKPKRRTTKAEK
jgi:ribonuclease R